MDASAVAGRAGGRVTHGLPQTRGRPTAEPGERATSSCGAETLLGRGRSMPLKLTGRLVEPRAGLARGACLPHETATPGVIHFSVGAG